MSALRPVRRWLPWLLPVVALALVAPALWQVSPFARSPAAEDAAREALAEGNRLVREAVPEQAVETYASGWRGGAGGDADGLLAYNLGTTLHRLDRRAEALLWYRRAEPLRPADEWLAANLALVRHELAAPRRPPPGVAAWIVTRRRGWRTAAVAAAWAALGLLVVRRLLARAGREPRRAAAAAATTLALAAGSLALWLAPLLAAALAPRPAVLLAACGGASTAEPLPAGSEVWVRPVAAGGWRLDGGPPADCPAGAIAVL